MAEAAVSFAVEKLGDLLIQEVGSLYGVRSQVEELKTELDHIRFFLQDADRRQEENDSIRNLVAEIREVAYDAEDLIDAFTVKEALRRRRRKNGGWMYVFKRYSCVVKEWVKLHKVGSEIQNIKSQISTIKASLQAYGIRRVPEGESSGLSSMISRQGELIRSYSHLKEDVVVGFEEDTKMLVAKLVDAAAEQSRVALIHGMGGVGKTTLAKEIYHLQRIRSSFVCFAWVYISQEFQTRKVWEEIIFSLSQPSREERDEILKLTDAELAKRLYQVQEKSKCLVILDDTWKGEAWDLLSPAFPPQTTSGSKILITTRNKEVAHHAEKKGFETFVHGMKCLDEEKSWELFRNKVLSKGRSKPVPLVEGKMEQLGRKMVQTWYSITSSSSP